MTNVLSDRPDESIYTEDNIRGRYTFLARKKMHKPVTKNYNCFIKISYYLKVGSCKSMTLFIFCKMKISL
jgi:hypothetical protein